MMLRQAPFLSPLRFFSSLHCPKSTLKPSSLSSNTFKFPSFSSSPPRAMSTRTANDVLMAAARAAATRNKKPKTTDDGATPSKNPNPMEPSKDPKPTPQPKEKEPSLSVDDRITSLRKKPTEFKPRSAAFWKDGERVPFLFLARALDLIAGESGRIAMTDILCNVFRTVMATTPQDLIAAVYLSANRIAPSHEGVELGIGDASLIKALAEAYGRKEEHIKNQLKVTQISYIFHAFEDTYINIYLYLVVFHVFVMMSQWVYLDHVLLFA